MGMNPSSADPYTIPAEMFEQAIAEIDKAGFHVRHFFYSHPGVQRPPGPFEALTDTQLVIAHRVLTSVLSKPTA